MFESICIRQKSKSSLGHPFDLGVVAEALVFYGKVRVMASHANLDAILRTFTPEGLIELLESDYLKLAYEAEQLGIQTVNTNTAGERYAPVGFSAPKLQLQNHLPNLLMQITGKAGRGRRLARRIARKVEEVKYDRNITEEALTDLELPPIGWQLFILGNSKSDSTAFPLFLDTYATRLLAEPLSRYPKGCQSSAHFH